MVDKFISTKNDISAFPFSDFADANGEELELLAQNRALTAFNSWMLPQLAALFGRFTAHKNENGKYSALQILRDNIGTDKHLKGIWKVVTKLKRSSLVKAQIAPAYSKYSSLVPLILAGLKEFQGIQYSEYELEGLEHIVERNLYDAMTCGFDPSSISIDRRLELLEIGTTTKTGNRAGTKVAPTSKWAPTGVTNTEIGTLPKLAQTMLLQMWVAHPTVRSSYMILDPSDWDIMPEPLVGNKVLTSIKADDTIKCPWE